MMLQTALYLLFFLFFIDLTVGSALLLLPSDVQKKIFFNNYHIDNFKLCALNKRTYKLFKTSDPLQFDQIIEWNKLKQFLQNLNISYFPFGWQYQLQRYCDKIVYRFPNGSIKSYTTKQIQMIEKLLLIIYTNKFHLDQFRWDIAKKLYEIFIA